jgi:esterase/lipase superfamily enzyme
MAACAQTPDRISFAEPVPNASVQEIYVNSGRLPSTQARDLQQDRNARTNFARYDVSIPGTHGLGQIEWPDGPVDPETDFAVVGQQDFGTSDALIKAIQAEPGDEVTLFVHGYNNTPSEALYRFAQISHDFEIDVPRVLFAWPSSGTATGYVYDRDSVLFSRDPLANLLTDIARQTSKEITLMAHSMGSHLTMEVLRQLAITGRRDVLDDLRVVALLAPDIDPDLFRTQAAVIGTLPDPFVILTNRDDKALRLSSFLNIGRQKVGDLSRAADVEGLKVTLFDFTALKDGSNRNHLVPMTSPTAIAVLRDLVKSDRRGALDLSQFDISEDGVIRARALEIN